jgi:hypothetical protein
MSRVLTLEEVGDALRGVEMSHPIITPEAADLLGPARRVIEEIGMPKEYREWYRAVDPIRIEPDVKQFVYDVGEERRSCGESVRIGGSNFGSLVLDPSTGHVVYVEPEGYAQLINTSIEKFLYFIGRFHQSFKDPAKARKQLERDCRKIDPAPFLDENAIWSVTIEEMEAGFYN